MGSSRFYPVLVFPAALALVVSCAGCWETIEYDGPRTVSTTKQSPEPAPPRPESNDPSSPADVTTHEAPLVVATEPPGAENPPSSPAAEPSLESTDSLASSGPTVDPAGDRYATPPPAETPAAEQPTDIFPPSEPPVATDTTASASEVPASDHPPGILPSSSATETAGIDVRPPSPPESTAAPASPSEPPATAPAVNDAQRLPSDATSPPAADATQKPSALNPRRAAWLLGSWLSLAALANDRGVAIQNVPTWLEYSRKAARFLGISVPDLPAPPSPGQGSVPSKQVVDYLLVNGQRIGRELAQGHGAEEAALFEIALKTNILLVLYSPGASAADSIALAVTEAAPRAKLPSELWQPVVSAIQERAQPADVRTAVQRLHTDADKYLAQPAESNGQ